MSTHRIECQVNGESHSAEVASRRLLSDFLRDDLHLTGTKRGCETGTCGACSVLLDGEVIKSCLMLAVEAIGKEIITVEGLKDAPIQKAFVEKFAFQCGYCTSGFLMVCHALLQKHPHPTDTELEDWLQSNICRCTSYQEIGEAARAVIAGEY
ncbi:6-hydroxypseudooxynicotine dehydrogenase complex subunit beta [bioreactor metagenome]|uniref:6-hydroxypseudooxynicotine dehydrogenase complex subunit beta n=1 Tax=bioreactor metagenome TaxID=1076179 RepID=A0A645I397_9ZZZZ